MLLDQLIGYAAAVKILPDSLRKVRMKLPGKLHEIAICICHAATVAVC